MIRRIGAGRESKRVAVIVDSARETRKPPDIPIGGLNLETAIPYKCDYS